MAIGQRVKKGSNVWENKKEKRNLWQKKAKSQKACDAIIYSSCTQSEEFKSRDI